MLMKSTYLADGVESKNLKIYQKIDSILNSNENEDFDFESLKDFIKIVLNDCFNETLLYSRLGSRLKTIATETDNNYPEFNTYDFAVELCDEGEECLKSFRLLFENASRLNFSCGLRFELDSIGNLVFDTLPEIVEFVTKRKFQSLVKFYTLFRIFNENELISLFSDSEYEYDFISILNYTLNYDIETFYNFLDYAETLDIKIDSEIVETIKFIENELEKGY